MKKIAILLLFIFTVSLVTASAGYKYRNIAGAATTVVRSGPGRLVQININKSVLSTTITVYDNTAASGTKIATITNPSTLHQDQYSLAYNCAFNTGLTIVTSGADDITVIYE